MTRDLALVDPKQASAERIGKQVVEIRDVIDKLNDEDELDLLEVWLVAAAKRLRQLKQDASEAEASRVMTIRQIGKVIGPAERGHGRHGEGSILSDDKIKLTQADMTRRHAARLLAEHAEIVDKEIAEFLSTGKPAISLSRMVKVCQRRRSAREIPFTERRYSLLYVDPPWRYEGAESGTRQIENQYGTMPLDEIKALKVPAADDATLFLWTTSPKLADGLAIVKAWDFEYRTCMVWVKDKIGMGYYARQQHELLLIAKRGKPLVPAPQHRPSSVIHGDRSEHSAKPEVVYELIESMYPEYERGEDQTDFVELFARIRRHGWDAWGLDTAIA